MNWMALLGILVVAYSLFCFWVTVRKPAGVWEMAKVKSFRQVLGESGTQILFAVFSLALFALGIWLIVK